MAKPRTLIEAVNRYSKSNTKENLISMNEFEPGLEPAPCSALPGTGGKVEILAGRVERGEKMWHENDVVTFDGDTAGEMRNLPTRVGGGRK